MVPVNIGFSPGNGLDIVCSRTWQGGGGETVSTAPTTHTDRQTEQFACHISNTTTQLNTHTSAHFDSVQRVSRHHEAYPTNPSSYKVLKAPGLLPSGCCSRALLLLFAHDSAGDLSPMKTIILARCGRLLMIFITTCLVLYAHKPQLSWPPARS